jgi:hypothetical protein
MYAETSLVVTSTIYNLGNDPELSLKCRCLNQDASQRGTVQPSDYFAEAPVIAMPPMGGIGPGTDHPVG